MYHWLMSNIKTDIITIPEIIALAGGEVRVALDLGITQFAVRNWRAKGYIPGERWAYFLKKGLVTAEQLYEACRQDLDRKQA